MKAVTANLFEDVRNLRGALPTELSEDEQQRYARILYIHDKVVNAPSQFRAWLWAVYLQHLCCRYLELYEYKVMACD